MSPRIRPSRLAARGPELGTRREGLPTRCSLLGKLKTSVGLLTPRNRRFKRRTWPSLTIAMFTSPRARAGAISVSQRARPAAPTRRPHPSDTSTRTVRRCPSGSMRAAAVPVGERLVRFDNLLHELVTDHIALVEIDERDSLDTPDDLHRLDETRRPAGREINLRDVPRD